MSILIQVDIFFDSDCLSRFHRDYLKVSRSNGVVALLKPEFRAPSSHFIGL